MNEPSKKTRRALLTGGAALAGGAVIAATTATEAQAADGQALLAGRANTAAQATYLTSSTKARGLTVTTTDASTAAHAIGGFAKGGAGIHAESTTGHGALLRTKNAKTWGAWITNNATAKGAGGALRADGGQNPGIVASTADAVTPAILVRNLSPQASDHGRGFVALIGVDKKPPEVSYSAGEFVGPSGVVGFATARAARGVTGWSGSVGGVGVHGIAHDEQSYGVIASASGTGKALVAEGASEVIGDLHVTKTITQGLATSRIDHPLDPAHKYLSHPAVESPEPKTVYDGVATADGKGRATVTLPDYFEALNEGFRYQLTPIGRAKEQVYVSTEVRDSRFSIAGANPGQRISWQVTGVRKDAFASDHRVPVEQDKPADERGTYLYPEGFDQPKSAGLAAKIQARLTNDRTER